MGAVGGGALNRRYLSSLHCITITLFVSLSLCLCLYLSLYIYIYIGNCTSIFWVVSGINCGLQSRGRQTKKGKKEGAKRTVSMDGRERKMPEQNILYFCWATPKFGSYHLPSPRPLTCWHPKLIERNLQLKTAKSSSRMLLPSPSATLGFYLTSHQKKKLGKKKPNNQGGVRRTHPLATTD